MIFHSCNLDPCKDVTCNHHGGPQEDSNECVCICDTGWEGDECTIRNKCKGIICVRDSCNPETGLCACSPGFEGDSCNIFSREKFLDADTSSTWDARDTCSSTDFQYYIVGIEKGIGDNGLYVVSFLGHEDSIRVAVNESEFLQQSNVTLGSVTISNLNGQISANRDTIYVTYNSTQSGIISNCRGVWTRL